MTQAEKMDMVMTMTGETDEAMLSTYLTLAAGKILRRCYPFDDTVTAVPDRYAHVQVQIAAYMVNKRGAEGETAHSENGVSRSYENGDVPESLLREVVPFASVM